MRVCKPKRSFLLGTGIALTGTRGRLTVGALGMVDHYLAVAYLDALHLAEHNGGVGIGHLEERTGVGEGDAA